MTDLNNMRDVIDSRDVIARIEELQDERTYLTEQLDEDSEAADIPTIESEIEQLDEELAPLLVLAEEAEGYAADWQYGEQLIRDTYFQEYARELADDIGALENANSWPLTCIDWDQAARDLQMDYTAVEFDGITYWIR